MLPHKKKIKLPSHKRRGVSGFPIAAPAPRIGRRAANSGRTRKVVSHFAACMQAGECGFGLDWFIGEGEIEFADVELIAFVDAFCVDAVASVFDAVCRVEIFHVVGAAFIDNGAVFARDVAVTDNEVGQLG